MKSRLHRIEITNFKAFREFKLDLEGRHLLVYGANGSGKSSLYWALYTFLQSARKQQGSIAKYFEPDGTQNLLNIFEQEEDQPKPGEIALTFRDSDTSVETPHRISQADHSTRNDSLILKGNLASDFITYRFFFGFSDFKNSEKFNLWPLFEKEILPFCVSTGGKVPLDCWNAIKSANPNPGGIGGVSGTQAYDDFKAQTNEFAGILAEIIDSISTRAQKFYDFHFSKGDPAPVKLKLASEGPTATGENQSEFQFTPPTIEFGIQVGGKTITRPQSFLNEAKLTQLALSVRFAASLVNLHESDLKLLVLDDLLVSLDMSNRMKVVEILLSDTFENYQKIILTHDLGLFHEFRRKLGANHANWCALHLQGTPKTNITIHDAKSEIQKSVEYLNGYNLDEAALCLRKATEAVVERFNNRDQDDIPCKEFIGLTENLRAARNKVLAELPVELYRRVLENTPSAYLGLLVPEDNTDLEGNADLDQANQGILKCQRRRLRQLIMNDHIELLRKVKLFDDILACTARVLNPAAHTGDPPLYEKEVEDALKLVKQLDSMVNTPSASGATP